jgi:hypothetical protein
MDKIKDNIKDILIIMLFLILLIIGIWGTIVSNNFKKYKEDINDQVNKSKLEKQRVDTANKEFMEAIKHKNDSDIDLLTSELERMRKFKDLPRDCNVPVANGSSTGGTMPSTEESTGVTYIYLEDHAGIISRRVR